MEQINRDWLAQHLDKRRGEQARLSRETGISKDKISKILRGVRQIQLSEAPLIYRFFYPDGGELTNEEADLLAVFCELTPTERDFLLKCAKGLISERHRSPQKD